MKIKLLFSTLLGLTLQFLNAQISTESFEDEADSQVFFTDNAQQFNITSYATIFDVQTNYPGTGFNGTANDNKYIDNSGTSIPTATPKFGIKTNNGNTFKLKKFWLFISNDRLNHNVSGTIIVTGKLAGTTKFTVTKSSGFATSNTVNNGYTLFDFTTLGGTDNSNVVIDEFIVESTGGQFNYLGLDALTWEKSPVLSINEQLNRTTTTVYPNPTIGVFYIENDKPEVAEIYNYAGLLIDKISLKNGKNKIDISNLPTGNYIIKLKDKAFTIMKR